MSGAATRRISADGSDEVDISLVGDFAPWDEGAMIDAGECLFLHCTTSIRVSDIPA